MAAFSAGLGDSEAVVGAVIHPHVVAARHMALDTLCAGSNLKQNVALRRFYRLANFVFLFVEMVFLRVVLRATVTLQAKLVAFLDQFDGVHVVTVTAAHVMAVHFALCEGAVHVNLVLDLAVRKIQAFVQQAGQDSYPAGRFPVC